MTMAETQIRYFKRNGFSSCVMDNVRHTKVLPYLSIVQSVEGSYDITLGRKESGSTGTGGFFIAPSNVHQDIVHHADPISGQMRCRWVFLDVRLHGEASFDQLYSLPTVVKGESAHALNELFDRLFESESVWRSYAICYELLDRLASLSRSAKKPINEDLQRALRYMTEHYAEPITVASLAHLARTSESNLYAVFKRQMGSSPIAYLNRYRTSLAAERLIRTDQSITEIACSVGIDDPLYFSKLFKKHHDLSPKQYRLVYQKQDET